MNANQSPDGIPAIEIFGANRLEDAMRIILAEKMDEILCFATGSTIGCVDTAEIRICLQMELNRSPLASVDDLVESWSIRQYAMSSNVAPSLRHHKDHHTLLRLLKADNVNGPARILAYMASRLFFEALIPQRMIPSTEVRRARLAWLIDFRNRIDDLPTKWYESLTAEDESNRTAESAVNILSMAAKLKPSAESEGKAAQLCLEALLRLDAIHNLRHSFYNIEFRDSLIAFRDSDDWTFWQFRKLLDKIEQDGIIKLQRQRQPAIGNSMAVSMALESLNWSRKRHGISREKFLESFEQGRSGEKFDAIGTGVSGNAILNSIKELMNSGKSLSKTDKRELESALRDLYRDINSVSTADKRLEAVRRDVARFGIQSGTVTRIAGDTAIKHLAESYADHNVPLPAALQSKFESITRDKKQRSSILKKRAKSSERLAKKYDMSAIDDKLFNNIGLNLAQLNVKPDNSGKKE